MVTYLMVLVVRSEDPAVLLRLAELAHEDMADAQIATKLLLEEERLTLVAWPTLVFSDESATFVMGRRIPHVTDYGVNESGQPVVTFERVDHEQVRIEAAVEDTSAIVEGRVKIDDDDDLVERSFFVVRDGDPVAQILAADTLLIGIAASTERGQPPPYPVPALPDSPRARRQLLDEILHERP